MILYHLPCQLAPRPLRGSSALTSAAVSSIRVRVPIIADYMSSSASLHPIKPYISVTTPDQLDHPSALVPKPLQQQLPIVALFSGEPLSLQAASIYFPTIQPIPSSRHGHH